MRNGIYVLRNIECQIPELNCENRRKDLPHNCSKTKTKTKKRKKTDEIVAIKVERTQKPLSFHLNIEHQVIMIFHGWMCLSVEKDI